MSPSLLWISSTTWPPPTAAAVKFTSTDTAAGAVVPANYTFLAADNGVHVFTNGFTLQTVGQKILTATDIATITITGSATVTVPVTLFIPQNLTGGRGGVVAAPISNVNEALNDPINQNSGLAAGSFVVYYNPNQFTVSAADVSLGTLTTAAPGWSIATNFPTPGYIGITLTNDGTGIITGTSGGTLVSINFHVKSNAILGPNQIDLAADTSSGSPFTSISDQNFGNYNIEPAPVDNTVLTPVYAYTGSDATDGTINVTGINLPPVVVNDSYTHWPEPRNRGDGSGPAGRLPPPAFWPMSSDPQGFPLTAAKVTSPSYGTLTLNSDGSPRLHAYLGLSRPRIPLHLSGQRWI